MDSTKAYLATFALVTVICFTLSWFRSIGAALLAALIVCLLLLLDEKVRS